MGRGCAAPTSNSEALMRSMPNRLHRAGPERDPSSRGARWWAGVAQSRAVEGCEECSHSGCEQRSDGMTATKEAAMSSEGAMAVAIPVLSLQATAAKAIVRLARLLMEAA